MRGIITTISLFRPRPLLFFTVLDPQICAVLPAFLAVPAARIVDDALDLTLLTREVAGETVEKDYLRIQP